MTEMKEVKEVKDFKKIDKITRIVTITVSVILGSIFLGACVYMLHMINEPQDQNSSNTNTIQNMNLVNM